VTRDRREKLVLVFVAGLVLALVALSCWRIFRPSMTLQVMSISETGGVGVDTGAERETLYAGGAKYWFHLGNVEKLTRNGKPCAAEELQVGDWVRITYNGRFRRQESSYEKWVNGEVLHYESNYDFVKIYQVRILDR